VEGEDVLGSLLGKGLGQRFVPSPGVARDQGALTLQQPPELGQRRDGGGLVLDLAWAAPQALGVGPHPDPGRAPGEAAGSQERRRVCPSSTPLAPSSASRRASGRLTKTASVRQA
jgi:hypothetical protein